MTHEPIRVIHFSPHITWQGTQSELDAMLAEGCPVGSASEIIAACKRDAAEAEAYADELEANLAKAEALMFAGFAEYERRLAKAMEAIEGLLAILPDDEGPEIDYARTTIGALKGDKP